MLVDLGIGNLQFVIRVGASSGLRCNIVGSGAIQLKCLADGTDCNLDGASTNLIALSTGASTDMFSKGGDEFDSVINGDVGVHHL